MLPYINKLIAKIHVSLFSWSRNNSPTNQRKTINKVSKSSVYGDVIGGDKHIHNQTPPMNKGAINTSIMASRPTDWSFHGHQMTLDTNPTITADWKIAEGDWNNIPLVKSKVDSRLHDPATYAETITIRFNNNPVGSFLGLWLDGGRVMIPFPENSDEKPDQSFDYYIDNSAHFHIAVLRTNKQAAVEAMLDASGLNFWLHKLNINNRCDLTRYVIRS